MTDDPEPRPADGWIYIVGWETFQHDPRRRMTWHKTYVDLLDNPDYTDLTDTQRALLHGLWMLAARVGNGRLRWDQGWIKSQLRFEKGVRIGSLERLIHAGWIEVRANKALASGEPNRRPRGLSKDNPYRRRRENSSRAASQNGKSFIPRDPILYGWRPLWWDPDRLDAYVAERGGVRDRHQQHLYPDNPEPGYDRDELRPPDDWVDDSHSKEKTDA